MNFVKCKLCRETFNSYGSPICPACIEQIDKDFFIVRDYIYDHPNKAHVENIAEATGVKEKHIVYLLEEGRFESQGLVAEALGSQLKCRVCGRPIVGGKLCSACQDALTKELGVASASLDFNKSPNTYVTPRSSKTN